MRIPEIAQTRVRYGYRKIRVLLNREGWKVGKYLVERLYREEGLTLHQRRKRRRRVAEHRRERFHPTGPNQVWSMDFVADQLADGRRFRSLTVVDIYTRECLAIESEQRLKGEDVVLALNRIKTQRGVPSLFTVTMGASFPVMRWISGPIRTECEWPFPDQGNQLTMRSWNRSTERSGQNV
jgi:putative transposase